jgi:glucose-6-phosphate 1-dehydrogenase
MSDGVVAYLALPPAVFAPTIEALKKANLPEGSRVAIEKPFGENLESAEMLNCLLYEFLPEGSVFRIDHFLAWQPFSAIMGLRFANGIFEPLWDRNHTERVAIVWEETLALEGRLLRSCRGFQGPDPEPPPPASVPDRYGGSYSPSPA